MAGRYDAVAVLVPCLNEAPAVGKVVDDFHRELPDATVWVYDNGSDDGTAEIARENGALVRHESRRGKGNVIRSMLRVGTRHTRVRRVCTDGACRKASDGGAGMRAVRTGRDDALMRADPRLLREGIQAGVGDRGNQGVRGEQKAKECQRL